MQGEEDTTCTVLASDLIYFWVPFEVSVTVPERIFAVIRKEKIKKYLPMPSFPSGMRSITRVQPRQNRKSPLV